MVAVACIAGTACGALFRPARVDCITQLAQCVALMRGVRAMVGYPVRHSGPRRRETGREQE